MALRLTPSAFQSASLTVFHTCVPVGRDVILGYEEDNGLRNVFGRNSPAGNFGTMLRRRRIKSRVAAIGRLSRSSIASKGDSPGLTETSGSA